MLWKTIMGDSENGVPNIISVLWCMFTFGFVDNDAIGMHAQEVKNDMLGAENAIGLLAALILSVASAQLYTAQSPWTLGLSFISCILLLGAVCCCVLKLLLVHACHIDDVIDYKCELGNVNRLSGQIFIAGGFMWVAGSISYLFDQVDYIWACGIVGIFLCFGFVPFFYVPQLLIAHMRVKHRRRKVHPDIAAKQSQHGNCIE